MQKSCFLLNISMPAKLAILTYCANRTTNVPMYADAFGLLVFGALSASAKQYFGLRKTGRNFLLIIIMN